MTTEQARTLIWSKVVTRGITATARDMGKSTPRALHYFADGGLLSKDTVNALRAMDGFEDVPAEAWLAVLGVEDTTQAEATA